MPRGVYVRTPEYLEKQRLAGLRRSLELLEHMNQAWRGKRHTPDAREKIRKAKLNQSPETRTQISQALLGIKHSPEMREKCRQAKLGNTFRRSKKVSIEARQRMRQAHLNPSPETREKIRQARLHQHFPTEMTSIEQSLYMEFKKRRLTFEMHKPMFEKFQPDFVFEEVRLIVQADGDYWHSRPKGFARDCEFNAYAVSDNWTLIRFSEAVIKTDPARCARTVAKFVHTHRSKVANGP